MDRSEFIIRGQHGYDVVKSIPSTVAPSFTDDRSSLVLARAVLLQRKPCQFDCLARIREPVDIADLLTMTAAITIRSL